MDTAGKKTYNNCGILRRDTDTKVHKSLLKVDESMMTERLKMCNNQSFKSYGKETSFISTSSHCKSSYILLLLTALSLFLETATGVHFDENSNKIFPRPSRHFGHKWRKDGGKSLRIYYQSGVSQMFSY